MKTAARVCMTALVALGVSGTASGQTTQSAQPASQPSGTIAYPVVTFGTQTFLQYAANLHEAEGYNAFDVTRGYLNINAQLSPRVRFRFTPDVRPTTDATLNSNLTLRLEYASLEANLTDRTTVLFGLHETPWIAFEQSINRYRVQSPMFSERLGLIPGQTDLGASVRMRSESAEIHVGVYNGEGNGRAELDRTKGLQGRVTVTPLNDGDTNVKLSGFYSYGWYARDRPRNIAIVMGSYESPNAVVTAQFLQATDNPFIARDVKRRGLSFFGEGRGGPEGWAGFGRLDFFDPDVSNASDLRRRLTLGGAHWSKLSGGRFGFVVSYEHLVRTASAQLLERRVLAQTHVEF